MSWYSFLRRGRLICSVGSVLTRVICACRWLYLWQREPSDCSKPTQVVFRCHYNIFKIAEVVKLHSNPLTMRTRGLVKKSTYVYYHMFYFWITLDHPLILFHLLYSSTSPDSSIITHFSLKVILPIPLNFDFVSTEHDPNAWENGNFWKL